MSLLLDIKLFFLSGSLPLSWRSNISEGIFTIHAAKVNIADKSRDKKTCLWQQG